MEPVSPASSSPQSPFAPHDKADEFVTVCIPLLRDTFRAILQQELASIRGEVASLTGAVQALAENVSLQKAHLGNRPLIQEQLGMGSCGSGDVPAAPAENVLSCHDYTHEGEGYLKVQGASPARSPSAASNLSKGGRILKIVPMGHGIDLSTSSASKRLKRQSSVNELQDWRANDLLSQGTPKTQAQPCNLNFKGIVPAGDAPTSHEAGDDMKTTRTKSPILHKGETLRQLRETQLLSATNLELPSGSGACLIFGACGVRPWVHDGTSSSGYCARCTSVAPACCRWAVLSITLGSAACCSLQFFPEVPLGFGLKSDLALACGSIASLIAVGAVQRSSGLASCFKMLASRSRDGGCLDAWMLNSRRECLVAFCSWVCAVASRGILARALLRPAGQMSGTWLVLSILPFAVCSGVVLAAASCVLQICLALGGLIDAFSSSFIAGTSNGEAVQKWNELQAMIRRAGASIQRCVAILLCMVVVAMLLAAADFALTFETSLQAASLAPLMIILLGVVRAFFNAAEVTSKCGRVPQLINSLDFGTQIDNDRLYLVEYIVKSAAGFYVYEIRISSGMVLKYIYVCCVLSVAFANELRKF